MNLDHNLLKSKKILITGGLGFVGSNIAHKCLALGADVSIYDCLDPHSGGNLYNVETIKDSLKLNFHDILNFDRICEHVMRKDIIINCAASTSHPFSMREPWIDMDVNVKGVINILEAIRRFNSSVKFIHLGTSTQLGALVTKPADETHPEFPTDIYSANKSVSEKYVLIYAKVYGINAGVIRLSNIFGPRASIHSPEFTFNNYFVGLALQNKAITVYGDGEQLRNVLYIDDAVDAILKTATHDNFSGKVFFATGDKHYSVMQIAEKTVKHIRSGNVLSIPWPSDRKSSEFGDAIISNAKIKEFLAWNPDISIEEGLERTREYFLPCLKKYLR